MKGTWRLVVGLTLLLVGLAMPAASILVEATDWPGIAKTIVNVLLLFGLQLLAIPAVALMGKANYDRIIQRVLRSVKPAGKVSRVRYQIGLAMLLGSTLFAWNAAYVPTMLGVDPAQRVWTSMGLDLILLASLFVLGGDFWDKLQAIFDYDARVARSTDQRGSVAE